MVKSTLIRNVNIVNEGKIFKGDLRIQLDKISLIAPSISLLQNENVVEGNNKYLIPGLIDDQVHFREPGFTHKGDIYSESGLLLLVVLHLLLKCQIQILRPQIWKI